jgi:predicted nucleotidyltransferase
MIKNLLDLSGKIDELIIAGLEAITDVATSLDIPFFVVGATARDMILGFGYNIDITRATVDIDLGVRISDWDQYKKMKEVLIATGDFMPAKAEQRLLYRGRLPIDIVPFGPIVDGNDNITWSPEHDVKMSLLGFEEAYHYSQLVRLRSNPNLDVLFATPVGLAVMKIVAWNERYPEGNKDGVDLAFVMRNYMDAGNQERLVDEHADLTDDDDFDYVLAGARLLGRDVAEMLRPATKTEILSLLNRETGEQDRYRLVEDMMSGSTSENFEEVLELLETFKKGMQDA